MPQQSPILQTSSPPTDSGFLPRKEFIREQRAAPNAFAIVAIAGHNSVRLYSFTDSVISALRKLLDSSGALSVLREDVQLNFFEFILDGKPWSSPKNVVTEKLLIDILATIYHSGYKFLSCLDYGRESDDRLAMAFSTPSTSHSSAALRESDASFASARHSVKEPFALSFVSPTLMRVIAPPLHLTPAILQAVRASWPRGVVSEKKVGDHSFEFKLKGYRWFQQDTFATDSLQHILALLSSLDTQSFSLVSSISLTNRSRMKDLWVFTGPATVSSDEPALQDALSPSPLNGDLKRRGHAREGSDPQPMSPPLSPPVHHRKFATVDGPPSHPHAFQHHVRAATDGNISHSSPYGYRVDPPQLAGPSSSSPNPLVPGLLRKPGPRAQVPISALHEADSAGEAEIIRANLPSTISTSVENMTGVGANGFSPDVFYTTSPFGNPQAPKVSISAMPAPSPEHRSVTPPERSQSPLRPVSTRSKTPPLLTSNPAFSNSPSPPQSPTTPGSGEPSSKSGLLGPGAFRDSAFSSSTDATHDIPIKWIGRENLVHHSTQRDASSRPKQDKRMSSAGPVLPGGWQPSPIDEKAESMGGMSPESPMSESKVDGTKTPIHEVTSHVAAPEVTRPDIPLRKSEAAVVGLISESTPPPLPHAAKQQSVADSTSSNQGQGWVLVNVAGTPTQMETGTNSPVSQSLQPPSSSSEQTTPSPQAKAIVVMDAVDNKNTPSFKKRLFGLGRKNSKKVAAPETQVGSSPLVSEAPRVSPVATRTGFRERFKLMGTPEASRNEDKRVSID